jgi:hypothetical protein
MDDRNIQSTIKHKSTKIDSLLLLFIQMIKAKQSIFKLSTSILNLQQKWQALKHIYRVKYIKTWTDPVQYQNLRDSLKFRNNSMVELH